MNEAAREFYVYLHSKPSGEVVYVGKGHGKRARQFYTSRNPHHRRSLAKIGHQNVRVTVFPCATDEAFALWYETLLIKMLREEGHPLCNMTDGGDGVSGHRHSAESLAKMRAAQRGHVVTTEQAAKISAAKMGGVCSLETVSRMSAARKGRPWTERQRVAYEAKVANGTNLAGERHPLARLTPDLVRDIRRRYEAGAQYRQVAAELGMPASTVWKVVSRATWKDVV